MRKTASKPVATVAAIAVEQMAKSADRYRVAEAAGDPHGTAPTHFAVCRAWAEILARQHIATDDEAAIVAAIASDMAARVRTKEASRADQMLAHAAAESLAEYCIAKAGTGAQGAANFVMLGLSPGH